MTSTMMVERTGTVMPGAGMTGTGTTPYGLPATARTW